MPRTEIQQLGDVITEALETNRQQDLDLADIEDDRALELTTAIIYVRLLEHNEDHRKLPSKRLLALSEALKIRKLTASRDRSKDDA